MDVADVHFLVGLLLIVKIWGRVFFLIGFLFQGENVGGFQLVFEWFSIVF